MLMTIGLRSMVCVLAAALSTCSAPSSGTTPAEVATQAVAAEEQESAPAPERFEPSVVVPDPSSAVGLTRSALERSDPELAAEISEAALATAQGDELFRLWWLNARAVRESGTPVEAFATLASVADSEHPLARWARLERAKILIQGDAALAAAEVEPLTEIEWAGAAEARDLHAAALVGAGRGEEAEPLLRALLAEVEEGASRTEVTLPLAELLAASEDEDRRVEAVGLFHRVAMRAPLSRTASQAEDRIEAVLRTLPARRRRALRQPPPQEMLFRAAALARANRHEQAEEAYEALAERLEDGELRCEARLGQGRAIYYRRQRRRAAELLSEVAHECEQPPIRAWARYLAGKAYGASEEPERALAQYALLEEQVPQHSLADDARYRSALIDLDQGDEDSMVQRLESLPLTYPDGDMRGRALFRLAWRARSRGELETALRHLDATLADGGGEDREDLAGRAAYWRGCVLWELDRHDEARSAWTSVVETAPLTYYAQHSLARLAEDSPALAETARASMGPRGPVDITFGLRDEFETEAFRGALELLRVGEVEKAQRELAFLRAQSSSDDELLWVEAALLDRSGAYAEAVYITRRRLSSFMEEPPTGAHFARWRIAYPRAFADEVERAATDRSVPPQLIFAIAREESSFRPAVVSIAQAYGLTQLILPTARRFGRRIGVNVDAHALTNPSTNLLIGAEYMEFLWDRYADNPVVLPSAYNAGQGATDRWLRERPDQRLDEWIEEIPYDETRRYTRRVVQTWGIYSWLDHGELPLLRAELPQR